MFKHLFTFSLVLGISAFAFSGCDENKPAGGADAACVEATKKLGDQLAKANSDLAQEKAKSSDLQTKLDTALSELKLAKDAKPALTPDDAPQAGTPASTDATKPADATKPEAPAADATKPADEKKSEAPAADAKPVSDKK